MEPCKNFFNSIYVILDMWHEGIVNISRCCAARDQIFKSLTIEDFESQDIVQLLSSVITENSVHIGGCGYASEPCYFPSFDEIIQANISLYNNCNNKCDFCTQANKYSQEFVEKQKNVYFKTINALKKSHFTRLVLTDIGEPLALPEMKSWFKSLQPDDFIDGVFFNTNGHSLDDEYIEIFKTCKVPIYINVSLNATDRETYKSVMGVDAFDRVVKYINELSKSNVSVKASFVYYDKVFGKLSNARQIVNCPVDFISKDGNPQLRDSQEFKELSK